MFTIRNTGGRATSIISVSSNDSAQFRIGDDTCSGQTLAADTGHCTFTVTFSPAATATPGVLSALLQVLAEARNQSFLAIQGTAIRPATLTITPSELSFEGFALTWQSGEKFLTVTNTGDQSTGQMSLPQDPGAGFVISSNGCTTPLEPMQSCSVGIKFTPVAIAEVNATFALTSVSGAAAKVKLVGSGSTPPSLEIAPNAVRGCGEPAPADGGAGAGPCFPDTAVGQSDRSRISFTVTYVTPAGVGWSGETGMLFVNVGGANASEFVLASNDCGPSLVQNQHCTFAISFKPSAPGLRSATVEVRSRNGGRASATLEAIGLAVDGGAG